LEEMVQQEEQKETEVDKSRLRVLMDVLNRIEQVSAPEIDE
jgi:hypothetical protein